MSAHTNSITFEVTDSGEVIISDAGEVITPAKFEQMIEIARLAHAKYYSPSINSFSSHTNYRFDDCPACAKWSKASRMYDAERSDKARPAR